ncbi:MAG: site-specific integrase [Victivallales bacterium]|nr:site-specific integrase [Victivallales bacterium]
MARKNQPKGRGKGTGSIAKRRSHYYFRTRENGEEKFTLLRDEEGNPITDKEIAKKAATKIQPVLGVKTQEDMAHYISKIRGLETKQAIPLATVWDEYLAQPGRPDSGQETLRKYNTVWRMFYKWLGEHYPDIKFLSQVNEEIIKGFFHSLETTGVSDTAVKGQFGSKPKKEPSKSTTGTLPLTKKRKPRPVSGRTYNGYKQALKLIFKVLLPLLGTDHNPVEQINNKVKDSVSREEFTEEQVEAIFNGFDTGFFYETTVEKLCKGRKRERVTKRLEFKPMNAEQLKVLLYLCCYTGCRGQDGCLMKWSNIDMKKSVIIYMPRKTARKSGKYATIPLHPSLKKALEEANGWRDTNAEGEDYIIPAIARRYQYNPGGIQKDVMKVIRCATGLATTGAYRGKGVVAPNKYSLHSFRHTFVSFCANAGVSLDIVADVVGHSSPVMTKHYAHFSDEARKAILGALPSQETSSSSANEAECLSLQEKIDRMSPEEMRKKLLDLMSGREE